MRNHNSLPYLSGSGLICRYRVRHLIRKGTAELCKCHVDKIQSRCLRSAFNTDALDFCSGLIVYIDDKLGHHMLEDHCN